MSDLLVFAIPSHAVVNLDCEQGFSESEISIWPGVLPMLAHMVMMPGWPSHMRQRAHTGSNASHMPCTLVRCCSKAGVAPNIESIQEEHLSILMLCRRCMLHKPIVLGDMSGVQAWYR